MRTALFVPTVTHVHLQPMLLMSVSGGLAQLVATLVGSTKLLYAGPG